jgi:uncharacterized protein GlcG (DUF336 family)
MSRTTPLSAVAALLCLASLAPARAGAQPLPNPYGPPITTEAAKRVAAATLAEARKNGWAIYATVVETGGIPVYLERIDGVQNGSAEASLEKARTAALFKRPTKLFEDVVLGGKTNYLKLPGATPLEGGVPILVDGKIVGAVGVSGATSAQDGQCARAGAEAVSPPPK